MFFNLSYGENSGRQDALKILTSIDCGLHFNEVSFIQPIANTLDTKSWIPKLNSDWNRPFINLDAYASQPNFRLAFVVTNNNGNNLYLDNIEFFTDDNFNPVASEAPYSVYGGISSPLTVTFNLDTRQPVSLQVYNSVGQLITDNMLAETLNQTYTFDLGDRGKGIYIVRVQIGNQLSSKKVYVGY